MVANSLGNLFAREVNGWLLAGLARVNWLLLIPLIMW
jgi:hypothetical protein